MKELFSLNGRVNRTTYWLMTLGMCGLTLWLEATDSTLAAVLVLLCLWPALAICVKRWHDRSKSGWWVLIVLIPIVGAIWALIEQGFFKGTEGANKYGADPLAS